MLRKALMKRWVRIGAAVLAALWLVLVVYNVVKPLPEGISVEGPTHPAQGIEFLHDLPTNSMGGLLWSSKSSTGSFR